MSDFFRRFLREDPRKINGGMEQGVFLGTFGKHPGWNDHIEEDERVRDLGLRTDSLVIAKHLLYVQGIGRNIDSGAWDRLDGAVRLEGFDHAFLWQSASQFLMGRFWSSSDGKGRTRYPMAVAAHVFGMPISWGMSTVLPALERLRESCVTASTAGEVVAALDQSRARLRQAAGTGSPVSGNANTLKEFLAGPGFGADREGLFRILYQLERQTAGYAPGRFNGRTADQSLRPEELRVPIAPDRADSSLKGWLEFLRTMVDAAAPILLCWPVRREWVDVMLGEPGSDQLFCLRATTAKLPSVSDVPFNLDDDFRRRAAKRLDEMRDGQGQRTSDAGGVTSFFKSLFKRG